jgi:hypothetical protein
MVLWQGLCRKALHYSATVSNLNGFRQARLVQLLGLKVAHHVDPGIDRYGCYRRITGPPAISGSQAAYDAQCKIAGHRRITDWSAWWAAAS